MSSFTYVYDQDKNRKLKEIRGVNFDDVIVAIEEGYLLDLKPHHNLSKHHTQDILVVEINNYIYLVPCIEQENTLILKTVYPSRKATAVYLHKQGK